MIQNLLFKIQNSIQYRPVNWILYSYAPSDGASSGRLIRLWILWVVGVTKVEQAVRFGNRDALFAPSATIQASEFESFTGFKSVAV